MISVLDTGAVQPLERLVGLPEVGVGLGDLKFGAVRVRQECGERCLRLLADVRASRTYDVTTLSVALREARNLLGGS